MRIGIIADVHGNYEALREAIAVLDDAGAEEVWCLGDIVGYGASPNECVMLVAERCARAIAGNHDLAAVGRLELGAFSYDARVACEWTAGALGAEERWFLEQLELELELEVELGGAPGRWLLAHGSPRNPAWEYVFTEADAEQALEAARDREARLCLVGHTHIQGGFRGVESGGAEMIVPDLEPVVDVRAAAEGAVGLILNPGSVGQPRDHEWRGACAILDTSAGAFEFLRFAYDVEAAAERILEEGLPLFLARRLRLGM